MHMADMISVDTELMELWANKLSSISDAMSQVSSALGRIDTSEEWWTKVKGSRSFRLSDSGKSISFRGAREALSDLRSETGAYAGRMETLSSGIKKAAASFAEAERSNANCDNGSNKSSDAFGEGTDGADKPGFLESLGLVIGNGAKAVISNLKDCAAWWAQDWENKGISYRIANTTMAVVNIALQVGSIAAAWGLTAGSAGLATPAAVLVTTYSVNSIANSVADIWNCLGGDVEQVGKVNFLKSGMEQVGGFVGENLGNREAGENVAGIVYSVGSIASCLVNVGELAKNIKKAPDLAKALTPEAGKGLWDLVSKSPISKLAGDYARLIKDVPAVKDLATCGNLIWEASKNAFDVGKDAVDIANDTVEFAVSF